MGSASAANVQIKTSGCAARSRAHVDLRRVPINCSACWSVATIGVTSNVADQDNRIDDAAKGDKITALAGDRPPTPGTAQTRSP